MEFILADSDLFLEHTQALASAIGKFWSAAAERIGDGVWANFGERQSPPNTITAKKPKTTKKGPRYAIFEFSAVGHPPGSLRLDACASLGDVFAIFALDFGPKSAVFGPKKGCFEAKMSGFFRKKQ